LTAPRSSTALPRRSDGAHRHELAHHPAPRVAVTGQRRSYPHPASIPVTAFREALGERINQSVDHLSALIAHAVLRGT
jgi:hypothetical protein